MNEKIDETSKQVDSYPDWERLPRIHKLFIDNLLKLNFNKSQAYRLTYKHKKNADHLGSQLYGNVRIQLGLNDRLRMVGLSDLLKPERINSELEDIAFDKANPIDTRRKALETLANIAGISKHDTTINQTIVNPAVDDIRSKLLERLGLDNNLVPTRPKTEPSPPQGTL